MISFIEKLTGGYQADASVVDGKLILSFPGAIKPIIWQMDLSKAKASALEIQEKNGGYVLVLKTVKGETTDIAPFDERAKALDGLMAASRALSSAHGKIHRLTDNEARGAQSVYPKKKSRLVPILLSLFVVFALLWILSAVSYQIPQGYNNASLPSQQSANSAAQSSGVAVSADDFLSGR